jgi:hypothetical protein
MFTFLKRAIDCIFGAPEPEAPPPPPPPVETKKDGDEKPPVETKPTPEDEALRKALDEVKTRRKKKAAGDVEIPPPPRVPADAAPYRKAAEPPPAPTMTVHGDLKCEVEGNTTEARFSADGIDRIKVKTERRARRHFGGTSSKEIRHRVTEKNADSITFAYFRRSGKPLKVRWTRASVSDPLTDQMKGGSP